MDLTELQRAEDEVQMKSNVVYGINRSPDEIQMDANMVYNIQPPLATDHEDFYDYVI